MLYSILLWVFWFLDDASVIKYLCFISSYGDGNCLNCMNFRCCSALLDHFLSTKFSLYLILCTVLAMLSCLMRIFSFLAFRFCYTSSYCSLKSSVFKRACSIFLRCWSYCCRSFWSRDWSFLEDSSRICFRFRSKSRSCCRLSYEQASFFDSCFCLRTS